MSVFRDITQMLAVVLTQRVNIKMHATIFRLLCIKNIENPFFFLHTSKHFSWLLHKILYCKIHGNVWNNVEKFTICF